MNDIHSLAEALQLLPIYENSKGLLCIWNISLEFGNFQPELP
ncbi:MAG: hypothetical protein PVG12_05175 [Gammaproteobacteria bacterium]|jgi:hypothetical protein